MCEKQSTGECRENEIPCGGEKEKPSPENWAAERAELEEKLQAAEKMAETLRQEGLRVKADFMNFRARIDRDSARMKTLAAESAVLNLLPVLDNLDRAIDSAGSRHGEALLEGVQMVRSQFFSEEIDFAGGLFTPARLGLMQGSHAACEAPQAGKRYAMLVDLAGEDEQARKEGFVSAETDHLENPGRDSTAVTIVEIDLSLLDDDLIGKPRYLVARRYLWQGEKHSTLYQRLLSLAKHWNCEKIVVDASGVGAGVCSFLRDRLGERVIPLVFNQKIKSDLGWGFLAVVDTGRFQDFKPRQAFTTEDGRLNLLSLQMADEQERLQSLFQRQLQALSFEVGIGPQKTLKWWVPDGTSDPLGGLLHDDLVISAAMTAILDEMEWTPTYAPAIIQASDPIREMDGGF